MPQPETGETTSNAQAFGAGSDARLAGRPLSANPYIEWGSGKGNREAFDIGWMHCHRFWGLDVPRGRQHEVTPLPEVIARPG